jgi:hypothetical protein
VPTTKRSPSTWTDTPLPSPDPIVTHMADRQYPPGDRSKLV